jgi:hypothetical protein
LERDAGILCAGSKDQPKEATMRKKCLLGFVALLVASAVAAEAAVSRIVVVQASDAAGYVKAIEQGRALLKAKGSPGNVRVWRARFAGEHAGSIVVAIEYPSLEALAKDDALLQNDAELRAWVQGLDKFRKVVSDSIYEEMK